MYGGATVPLRESISIMLYSVGEITAIAFKKTSVVEALAYSAASRQLVEFHERAGKLFEFDQALDQPYASVSILRSCIRRRLSSFDGILVFAPVVQAFSEANPVSGKRESRRLPLVRAC